MKKIFTFFITLSLLLAAGCNGIGGESNNNETIWPPKKILVIGNSFSDDALTYFYEFAQSLGLDDDLVVGHLTIGGTGLEEHDINAKSNANAYTYHKITKEGGAQIYPTTSLKKGLQDEKWDLITIQQVSGKSGVASSYFPYLDDLIDYIKSNSANKNAKLGWHMTWAYQKDSIHPDFANYLNSQEIMYDNIKSVVESSIFSRDDIDVVIPSGTAIQNIRTSLVEDTVTRDGYHLNNIGKYVAALTWIYELYAPDLSSFVIDDDEISDDELGAIEEAVINAVEKPFEVTNSVDYPVPSTERYMDRLYLLSIGNSFTANSYQYLNDFVIDIGIKEYVIAYLYIGGTSLQAHYNNLAVGMESYSYRRWGNKFGYQITENTSIQTAIDDYDWDIITVQQVSQDSGNPGTYQPYLDNLITKIKEIDNDPTTKFGFHMTWAYHQATNHSGFGYYNRDQLNMYQKITETVNLHVVPHEDIEFIIPAGTAIQNIRATSIGDSVTINDGYHLNRLGEYIAGMTWIKTITNVDLSKITYAPIGEGVKNNLIAIKRAVNDASERPYVVTQH